MKTELLGTDEILLLSILSALLLGYLIGKIKSS